MKCILCFVAALTMMLHPVMGAATTLPTTRTASFHRTITKQIGYDYLEQLPRGYGNGEKFPLIIYLHGSGECGKDVGKIARGGLPRVAATQPAFPFVLIAPLSPSEKDWFTVESLDALLDHVLASYDVDPDRVYLTGISMGAYAVWDWACHRPTAFAAIAPIGGEGNDDFAGDLKHVPVWAFHGAADKAVSPAEEKRMVDAVNRAGGDAKLTMYEGVGHNAWNRAYAIPELFAWFLSHQRAKP
jgi:predicted peptidase